MWLIATYQPTSLFSLRPANATTSGGKTLLTPTPFAFKMALLDAAIRVYGKSQAEVWFPAIRDLDVAVQLPQHLMVVKSFIKILRPHKSGAKDTNGTGLAGPMGNTVAYREMVQFAGDLRVGIRPKTLSKIPFTQLLANIHYLGKRGGFMQLQGVVEMAEATDFTLLNPVSTNTFALNGTLQILDDCGTKMTFAHADIYSKKTLGLNKANGRLLKTVVLPYQLKQSSRSYSLYERIA